MPGKRRAEQTHASGRLPHVDPRVLVELQGVKAIDMAEFRKSAEGIWPKDESDTEFMEWLKAIRAEGTKA